MRTVLSRARRGIALMIALLAIVVIGTLIAGVFFMSTQEFRVGTSTAIKERAFRAAEFGLNTTLARWNSATMNSLPTGGVVTQVYDSPQQGWRDTVVTTKITSTTFWVVSTASTGRGAQAGAWQRTGAVVRLVLPSFNFLGALTVRGNTQIGGSSQISGHDTDPTTWVCPAPGAGLPGVAIASLSSISTSGCSNFSCIEGNPPVQQAAAANDTSTYFRYVDHDWATLTQAATKVYTGNHTLTGLGPVLRSDGSCDTDHTNNWGDPTRNAPPRACESYFPIIWARGTADRLRISGGRGQGILLVDGDLEMSGNFEFYGPIIVRGHLRTTGTGAHVRGAVMAANVALEQNAVLGDAIVRYSSCAVASAVNGSSTARPVVQRWWADMF